MLLGKARPRRPARGRSCSTRRNAYSCLRPLAIIPPARSEACLFPIANREGCRR
jgi:hypothetical protein